MIAIGTLLLAVLITILGSQGFQKSGFKITRNRTLHGRSATGAGAAMLLLSSPLWYFGTQQLLMLGRSIEDYFEEVAQKQKEEQEILASNARQRILVKGCEYFRNQDYEIAIKLFNQCTAGKEKGPTLMMRARSYHALGNFRQALLDLDEAIKDQYDDPDLVAKLYLLRGYTHYRLSQFQSAVDDIGNTLRLAPDDYIGLAAQSLRGWIYATCPDENFRNPELAAADAEQMASALPQLGWMQLEQLAAILASLQRWEEAINLQKEFVGHIPNTHLRMNSKKIETMLRIQRERLLMYQQQMPYHETEPKLELHVLDDRSYF